MSVRDTVLAVFPPPRAVAMYAAGIDIAESSMKCVILKKSGAGFELQSYAQTPLENGVIVGGDIEKRNTIIDVLRAYRLRLGVQYATASIPERKAYLYQTLVPGGGNDIRAGIEFDLEAHVPLPPGETVFDFEPVRSVAAGTIVAVTAYAKRMVDEYTTIFDDAGIVLRSLEVESQALARAVLNNHDRTRTVMIVDLGKKTTRIAIADNGAVSFTATLDIGGDALTEAVMKHFNLTAAEAETMKNERGFLMSPENRELVEALMITMSVVKDEVVRNLSYWSAPSDDPIQRRPIEQIILTGGGANLRGFPEYLQGFLDIPVTLANAWTNAFSLDHYVPAMQFQESLEYATAIGLAIRGNKDTLW